MLPSSMITALWGRTLAVHEGWGVIAIDSATKQQSNKCCQVWLTHFQSIWWLYGGNSTYLGDKEASYSAMPKLDASLLLYFCNHSRGYWFASQGTLITLPIRPKTYIYFSLSQNEKTAASNSATLSDIKACNEHLWALLKKTDHTGKKKTQGKKYNITLT